MADSNYTHLALIVDRSGSMGWLNMNREMDAGIERLLKDQAKEPGRITVDVTTFDTTLEEEYIRVAPLDVKYPLIHPRGGTALNDAIGCSVARVKAWEKSLSKAERPGNVIIVIVTDGGENASQEYKADAVKDLVKNAGKRWQFLFLGANIDAFAVGKQYGFAAGQTMQYAPSEVGFASAYAAASSNIATTRSTGAASSFTQEQREGAK